MWNPDTKRDNIKLESVQRRATKMLPGLKDLTYPDRLKLLNLPTSTFRRLRGDCIQVFKYLHNYNDVDHSDLFHVNVPIFHCTQGNQLKLSKLPQHTQLRAKFFGLRDVNVWNALPDDVVMAPNINVFKNRLDKLWKNNPLKFVPDV